MKNKVMMAAAAMAIVVLGASYATNASAYMARGNVTGVDHVYSADIPVAPAKDIPVGPSN